MAKRRKTPAKNARKSKPQKYAEKSRNKKSKPTQQKNPTKSSKGNRRNTAKANPKGKTKPSKQNVAKSHKKGIRSKTNRGRKVTATASKGISNKRTESGRLRVEPQKRGAKRIDFSFEKVRAIDKKINLFKEGAGAAIKKELKKRGGKPPRGIIVTVFDKQGREHTQISPLDFVVNKANVENFVGNMLDKMKVDFMAWQHGQKTTARKRRRKGKGKMSKRELEDYNRDIGDLINEDTSMTDENPYGDYNPDSIQSITIKFIV